MCLLRLHLITTFIDSERRKDGESADPDEKSWSQSEADIFSGPEETNEQSLSNVRSNFVFEIIYLCIIERIEILHV